MAKSLNDNSLVENLNSFLMIEKDTNYSFMLEAEQFLNFQKIKAVSDQFILNLPKKLQKKLIDKLEKNTQLLDTEPSLATNLYVLGKIYEARFLKAYACLSEIFFNNKIEIIDYNCGQGLAEIIYHDFLHKENFRQEIHRITLIDSSEKALSRAALHTQLVFPNVEIFTICKKIEEIQTEDITSVGKLTKLHLLTNIPEAGIDVLTHLSKVIKAAITGLNYFMCVSPYYQETSENAKLLSTFIEMMNPDEKQGYIEDLDINQLIPKKKWTCSLRIFVKDETKDGEYVLEKNKKYWLNRDNVKYSEDKKTLIKCSQAIEGEYILPNVIEAIEPKAFRGCEKLLAIVADNEHYISIKGVLYSHDMSRIIKYPQAKKEKSFIIPDTVNIIEAYAFAGCVHLKKIIIPHSLTQIGFGAFEYCIHLTNIKIPETVTRIEGSAFSLCASLDTLDFDPINCDSMENLQTDEDGVLCCEAWAFEGCSSLNTINIGPDVVVIPDFAFSFCEYVPSIELPTSITHIGKNAFSYCKQLEEITLTSSITSIGKDAFYWCKNLRTIWIPKGMTLYFKKFKALKEFSAIIKEKEDEEEPTSALSPVFNKRADAVDSIEIIDHSSSKQVDLDVQVPKRTYHKKDNKKKKKTIQKDKATKSKTTRKQVNKATPSLKKDLSQKKQQNEIVDPIINRILELAKQGNAKIQNKLGYLYEIGNGLEQNDVEAVKWYKVAAEQGYAKAQYNLAKQYALGRGVEQNDQEAMKWYLAAAQQGLANAMTNLGAMYATGRGVKKNEAKAVEWYQKAAKEGDLVAIHNLQKRGIEI